MLGGHIKSRQMIARMFCFKCPSLSHLGAAICIKMASG